MNRLLSLRVLIPLIIMLIAIAILHLSYQTSRDALIHEITQKVSLESRNQMSLLQGTIEQLIRLKQPEAINQLSATFASRADLINFIVVNDKGIIIASSNYTDINEPWRSIGIEPDQNDINQAINSYSTEVKIDPEQHFLESYSGLCANQQENILRPQQCGFIFYKIDLQYHYKEALDSLNNSQRYNAMGIIVGALLLIIIINLLITRRVAKLNKIINQFCNGNKEIRSYCWGQDELRWLGDTINSLLDKINDDETLLIDRQNYLNTLFEIIHDAIIVIDEKGIIQQANRAASTLLRYQESELIGLSVKNLMPPYYAMNYEHYLKNYLSNDDTKISRSGQEVTAMRKGGNAFTAELSISEMRLANVRYFVGVIRDISLRKEMENLLLDSNEQLQKSAITDSLTGLANRRHFDDILKSEINRATRDHKPLSLILGDIDHFKKYNDHYGHVAGDSCLKKVAQAITRTFQRAGELSARYGGEEFAIILPNTSMFEAKVSAEKLLKQIQQLQIPHQASETTSYVTMSLGFATYQASGQKPIDTDTLINIADSGLYNAKKAGRNQAKSGISAPCQSEMKES